MLEWRAGSDDGAAPQGPGYAGWEPLILLPDGPLGSLCRREFDCVAGLAGASPEEWFCRGVVALELDQRSDARCAFESAVAQRPDWKTLALAETVLRRRRGADHDAAERRELEEGIAALPRYTSCWARVAHALGVLLTSDRESSGALSWLIQAQSAFASLGNRAGEAQASDALGTEYAHVGRTELAAICYARSLALKLAIGDEQGIALTLGNLGRLALLLGRAEDAARLISTDLQLVKRAGLSRDVNFVAAELAQAEARAGWQEQAHRRMAELLASDPPLDRRLAFFIHKELGMMELRLNCPGKARSQLAGAVSKCSADDEYESANLQMLQAGVAFAERDPTAVGLYRNAADLAASLHLADVEIDARIGLVRSLLSASRDREAGEQLLIAAKRCRANGLGRRLGEIAELAHSSSLPTTLVGEEAHRPISWTSTEAGEGYVILERLGTGAHARVFRAIDTRNGLEVAIKQFSRDMHPDRDRLLLDRIRLEFESARRANHPNVLRVHSLGMDSDRQHYMTMECLNGGTLRKLMLSAAPVPQVCAILAQVAYALAALHQAGVVHRDLKPENVLLRHDGTPVLADFSIALLAQAGGATATPAGTSGYMAPEQLCDEEIDGRADLFALAAIAHEWISGRRVAVHIDRDLEGRMGLFRRRPVLSVETDAAALARLPPIVSRLLAADPADRPDDAAAVAEILVAAAAKKKVHLPTPGKAARILRKK